MTDFDYRLGIDLGSTSLGFACLKLNDKNEPCEILDMGVRIFSDGREDKSKESLCSKRRAFRGMRRNHDRLLLRKKYLIDFLTANRLFPASITERKHLETSNPFMIRSKAVTEQISLYELGRALFHLNQHRGFKSNRSEDKKNNTKTGIAGDKLAKEIIDKGYKTIGQYMYGEQFYRFRNTTDNSGKLIIDIYPTRQMYMDEFDIIWNKQAEYYPDVLSTKLKSEIERIIFFQRPLKRQQVGFCEFEHDKFRMAKAQLLFNEFRILQDINNLKINGNPVTDEQRKVIFNLLNHPSKKMIDNHNCISFDYIADALKSEDAVFNLKDKGRRDGLSCNITNLYLSDVNCFGDQWYKLSDNLKYEIIEKLIDYSISDDEIADYIKRLNLSLSDDKVRNIVNAELEDDYGSLSKEAIEKILPLLKNGMRYDEAVTEIYGSHSLNKEFFAENFVAWKELPKYQELFPNALIGGVSDEKNCLDYERRKGRINNPTVHIALNQLRIVVNEIIKKYGNPKSVTVELAREVKAGRKTLENIDKKQKDAKKIVDDAKTEIRKCGLKPTPFLIEKYKVWRNLDIYNPLNRIDLYSIVDNSSPKISKDEKDKFDLYSIVDNSSPKTISLEQLFNKEYEIEHVLPRSWTHDDSYANKIITHYSYNREKGDRTPYEYFRDKGVSSEKIEKIRELAGKIDSANKQKKKKFNISSLKWRFSENARDIFARNFKTNARDLTDTAYMSKIAAEYLRYICKNPYDVMSSRGTDTDLLKSIWEISDVLPHDYNLWKFQKWEQILADDALFHGIENENPNLNSAEKEKLLKNKKEDSACYEIILNEQRERGLNKKDRTVHYHHALDAFVLACIDKRLINYISSQNDYIEQQNERGNSACLDLVNGGIIEIGETLSQTRKRVLKENAKTKMPYVGFNKDELKEKLSSIIVSYRKNPDRIKSISAKLKKGIIKNRSQGSFAPIVQGTAYSIVKVNKIKDSANDMEIAFKTCKKDEKKIENKSLSCMVPVFKTKENKEEFLNAYALWQKNTKKKVGAEKRREYTDVLLNTITKDKAYKWYESDGNYAAEIYQIPQKDKFHPNPKGDWDIEILSNYYAFERNGRFFWKDRHPTAKLIMKLKINDVVRATFNRDENIEEGFTQIKDWLKNIFASNPEKEEFNLYFRVKKMTGGSIYLRPLHVAQEDGDTKCWKSSAESLKAHNVCKVDISATGTPSC